MGRRYRNYLTPAESSAGRFVRGMAHMEEAMKERPIHFPPTIANETIRAILGGTKISHRVPLQSEMAHRHIQDAYQHEYETGSNWILSDRARHQNFPCTEHVKSPLGAVGDRRWVQETWAHYHAINHIRRPDGRAFSEVSDGCAGYRADGFDTIEDFRQHIMLVSGSDIEAVEINGDRWRPSIHMPRWASRITLEVNGVSIDMDTWEWVYGLKRVNNR